MGCSNPHPHCQVWSLSDIPSIAARELQNLKHYAKSMPPESHSPKAANGEPHMLLEYARFELSVASRVVVLNGDWVALVPWWAVWPFEILSESHIHRS